MEWLSTESGMDEHGVPSDENTENQVNAQLRTEYPEINENDVLNNG